MTSTNPLELHFGDANVEIDCENGGRISSLRVQGVELLVRQTDDPLGWGMYPMIPFAGRIANAAFEFGGQRFGLPANFGAHAIHGYGVRSRWEVCEPPSFVSVGHRPLVAIRWVFEEPWPWRGVATQVFVVGEAGVEATIVVEVDEPQPISVGWHPWFRRRNRFGEIQPDLTTEGLPNLAKAKMYELDAELIPTGETVEPTPPPWDNCFSGVAQPIELRWGSLVVQLTSTASYWVIYSEPPHAVCVEPQSAPPDHVNHQNVVVVEPDTPLIESLRIRWQR